METTHTENQFEKYIVYLAVLLTPLLVLPSFANAFVTPKLAFASFAIGIVLIIKSIRSIMRSSISFSASTFDLPVLLLGGAYVVSSILQTPNKMEAYFLPGSATIMVIGVLFFFVANQLSKNDKGTLRYILFISSVLVAFFVLMASTGVFRSFSGLPEYMKSAGFTTLGGPLAALVMMVGLLPVGLSLVANEKDMAKKAFLGVALSIVVLASVLALFNVLPGKDTSPQLPGFRASWFVAVDSLKQSPLLGSGPGNYLTAFNRFRPISFNGTDLWSVRFTSAQNFVFTSITETGLVGAAALFMLFYFALRLTRSTLKKASKDVLGFENTTVYSLILIIGALFLFPATPTVIFIFFILLALSNHTSSVNLGMFNQSHHGANAPFATKLPVLIATFPVVVGILVYGYYAARVLSADLTYKRALDYVVANDGRGAYDTLQLAINTNPYVDRYRVSYAQVNLALANSIAQKEEISDQDRQTIAQLVQQAIREGKVAVALNPQRAGNWEVLASIYRAVMPLAQGADAFAVQTYSQAVALDPLNPNTRIALGGIYYAAGAYEDAVDVFKLAVAAKPDHANAHYNLAVAYRESGNLDRAIAEMGTVLSLVSRDSEDYAVASKALEDMQNKRAAEAPEGGSLTSPDSSDTPALEEPIDLPEDAEPPQPEVTPTPEPSPSPEAEPTPLP